MVRKLKAKKNTSSPRYIFRGQISENIQKKLPWIIMFLVMLIFGWDFFFKGKVFLSLDYLQFWPPWNTMPQFKISMNNIVISDVVDIIYPNLSYVSRCLKEGNIPLWNPEIFLGLPTSMITNVNPAFNILYLVLLYLFNPACAHSLAIVINLMLIMSFSYLFFLQVGFTRVASLIGSTVFAFNGHLMVMLEFGGVEFAFAGAAMSFYFFEKSLNSKSTVYLLLNAITMGLMLLGGIIQWVFFLIPLIGLYSMMKTFVLLKNSKNFWAASKPIRFFIVALLIAILIGLPNILFFGSYMSETQRTIRSFEWIKEHTATFYPEFFLTFIFPNFFGYHPKGIYFARDSSTVVFQNYNELMAYVGIVTIILLFFVFRVNEYKKMAFFWLLIIIGSFAVAMKIPGFYYFLYLYVPGFNAISPTRTIILIQPAIAYLSALGAHGLIVSSLTTKQSKMWFRGIMIFLGLCLIGIIGIHSFLVRYPKIVNRLSLEQHFQIQNPDFFQPLIIIFLIGIGFLLIAKSKINNYLFCYFLLGLLIADLLFLGLRVNTRTDWSLVFPKTSGFEYFSKDKSIYRVLPLRFHYNTFMSLNVSTLGGYASTYPASYLKIMSAIEERENPGRKLAEWNQCYVEPVGYNTKILPMFNVKYLVTPNNIALPPGDYELKYDSDMKIYQMNNWLPRVFIVYQYIVAPDIASAIDLMLKDDFEPGKEAVLEKSLDQWTPGKEDLSEPLDVSLEIQRVDSENIIADVDMKKSGLMILSEQYFPGWEAKVDEIPVELLKVNTVLMGVFVPKGKHVVKFYFSPQSIRIGFYSTIISTASCVFALFWMLYRRKYAKR